ncbi:hypothetical protein CLV35_1626 [Motilibacter peucedani]|uniref:MYXO-CTERM domain-containing protein n=1 Tax=Motilibacter peucedani TaxID=598650 RepID=A0A420XSR7_9ACTN|nr:hypothetical protein [Motilibacter peucedani]RKS77923.1 hypothetical protein CLV35_1626 [Motilibacter peucedani]
MGSTVRGAQVARRLRTLLLLLGLVLSGAAAAPQVGPTAPAGSATAALTEVRAAPDALGAVLSVLPQLPARAGRAVARHELPTGPAAAALLPLAWTVVLAARRRRFLGACAAPLAPRSDTAPARGPPLLPLCA